MKKIFLFILAAVALSSAGTFTAPTSYSVAVTNKAQRQKDSLTGITDLVAFKGISVRPEAIYAVTSFDSVAAADTVVIWVKMYDPYGNLVSTSIADSLSGATTYQTSNLKINKTLFGSSFTIQFSGTVAALKRRFKSIVLHEVLPVTGYNPGSLR